MTAIPTNAATTSAATLTPEQEAALKQLVADLNIIKPGAKPSAPQATRVQQSLTALGDAGAKPAPESVTKLAGELASAWGSQKMTATEQLRFAKELWRVLNHSALPAGDAEAAVHGAGTLLKHGGVNESTAELIVATLTSIASARQ
jgi:hypothetical protein